MSKTTLSKPTLKRAEAALTFAEADAKKEPTGAAGKRVFFAPEGHRRLTINLPEVLHKKLWLAAVEQDCNVTDIVLRALHAELSEK